MAHKILAIDDHPETLDIVLATLRQHGFNVVGALNPVKGLSLAESERPDLVLVDMNMPEMDGKEVCRRLRAHPDLKDTPIIMFTAEGDADQKLAGFEAGADDYLTKPTEPDEMIARIESMLESSGSAPAPNASTSSKSPPPAKPAQPAQKSPGSFDRTTSLPTTEKLIAVVGGRGGAGTTTVAINLALSLGQAGLPTMLVDLDMVNGHVALYLNQNVGSGSLNSLAHLPEDGLAQGVGKQIISYKDNVQLLLAKPNLNGRFPTLSAPQISSLMEAVIQPGRCVVVDLGAGVNETTQPVLDRADQVIVSLRPERVSLAAAKLFLHQLKNSLFPHTTLNALVFSTSSNLSLPLDAIQGFLGYPLLAIVAVEPRDMARAANKGVPLVKIAPQSKATAVFRHVAHRLVKT